ncbi:hypothetical protein Lser_V15G28354 [Lactuca serriola]
MKKMMSMQVMMVMVMIMVLLLSPKMVFAMKKRTMLMDTDGGGKPNSMEQDEELEPNNHHSIPRGSWRSGQGQSGQSTSNDNHT